MKRLKYEFFAIVLVLVFFLYKMEIEQEFADVNSKLESIVQEPEIVIEKETVLVDNMSHSNYKRILLDVKNILQNPELPTGCEVTSLATVINYFNPELECSKLALVNFLDQGEVGQTDPDKAFIGNPRSAEYSFGANAPVLVNTAEKYYAAVNLPVNIKNLTGSEVEDLMPYIVSGYPVIIWATISMIESEISTQWMVDEKLIQWHSNFHCLVLVGFDTEKHVYYFADPLIEGITEYDMDIFKDRYNVIGKQAIVIMP